MNTITLKRAIASYPSLQSKIVAPRLSQPNLTKFKQYLATIESIATGTPDHIVKQSDAAKLVANLPHLEKNRSRIEKLYENTRIEQRHFAISLDETMAFSRKDNIQSRMELYQKYAVPLAVKVSRQALQNASANNHSNELNPQPIEDQIKLVVFVSSTGFIAPGIDTALIKQLGLRRDTARVTVNFMGCAAAMNGLRVAGDHVLSHPTHKALVVCLELSSVNAVFEDQLNDVIIHSIFGDGCAAVVVGAVEEQAISSGQIVIRDHLSYLVEDSEDGIVLGVKDDGITCQLSRQLPDYIEAGVGPIIERFLGQHQLTKQSIDLWAVHPGGTRIIEKTQSSLGLSDAQVAQSWEVLRQYGNMLSPSVLFVMERLLFPDADSIELGSNHKSLTGIAFSFSPGVGVEGILFEQV